MLVLFEYIGIGLAAGIGLIFLAKFVMAGMLQRKNTYYDDKFDEGGSENE